MEWEILPAHDVMSQIPFWINSNFDFFFSVFSSCSPTEYNYNSRDALKGALAYPRATAYRFQPLPAARSMTRFR